MTALDIQVSLRNPTAMLEDSMTSVQTLYMKHLVANCMQIVSCVIAIQRCSVENQKAAIAVQSMAIAPFWFSTEHLWSAIYNALLALNWQNCQSYLLLFEGDSLLAKDLQEQETLSTDMVWSVVDFYKQAATLCRDKDLEQEAIAYSRLGRVYGKASDTFSLLSWSMLYWVSQKSGTVDFQYLAS